jgi:type IV secretory pathway TraG/TraD family ATPase VirD4
MERISHNREIFYSTSDNAIIAAALALFALVALVALSTVFFIKFYGVSEDALTVAKFHAFALKSLVFEGQKSVLGIVASVQAVIAFIVFFAVFAYRETALLNKLTTDKHLNGNRFISNIEEAKKEATKELDAMRWSGDSFTVGGVTLTNDRTSKHIVVMGQTGGGKTTVIKPALSHAISAGDLLIVYDNKTEFSEIICADNDPRDEKTVILGPWDKRSACWDFAKDLVSEQDARQFASTIIPSDKSGDSIFSLGGKAIITGALVFLMKTKGKNWKASDLYVLINKNVKDFAKIVSPHFSEIESLLSFDENGEPVTATLNMMQNAVAYANPILSILIASEENQSFSINGFLKQLNSGIIEKQIIILQGNKKYSSLQSTLCTLFLDTASAIINSPSFKERPASARGVWFMLDEFVQLNKLNNIKAIAEIGRSKGARLVMGFQDYSQLVETYGRESAEVLYGINQTHIFTKLSPKSADFVSKEAGRRLIAKASTSGRVTQKGGEYSVISVQEKEEDVIKPADFGRLQADKAGVEVIVTFGSNFYKLHQTHLKFSKIRDRYIPQDWTGDEYEEEKNKTIDEANAVEEESEIETSKKIFSFLKSKKEKYKKNQKKGKNKEVINRVNKVSLLIKNL